MKNCITKTEKDRLYQYGHCETAFGRKIQATDYAFDPKDFPPGVMQAIAKGIRNLQEEGVFLKSELRLSMDSKVRHTSIKEHEQKQDKNRGKDRS